MDFESVFGAKASGSNSLNSEGDWFGFWLLKSFANHVTVLRGTGAADKSAVAVGTDVFWVKMLQQEIFFPLGNTTADIFASMSNCLLPRVIQM